MFDFDQVKKSLLGYSDSLRSVRTEIEATEREIENVMFAPLAKEDAKAALTSWVRAEQAGYREALAELVKALPPKSLEKTDGSALGQLMSVNSLLHLTTRPGDKYDAGGMGSLHPRTIQGALCGLFGDVVLKTMLDALEGRHWPEGAIAYAAKESRLAKLNQRLTELQAREREMVAAAEELGVQVDRVQ